MSNFTKELTVTKISPRTWRVEKTFKYHVGSEDSEDIVVVPKGFETDLASVPRIFWIIIPPDGMYSQSAVLHDYLYFTQIYDRKKSDYIFYESMGVLKVAQWKRWIMWKSVRGFAWGIWKRHKKELENKPT